MSSMTPAWDLESSRLIGGVSEAGWTRLLLSGESFSGLYPGILSTFLTKICSAPGWSFGFSGDLEEPFSPQEQSGV